MTWKYCTIQCIESQNSSAFTLHLPKYSYSQHFNFVDLTYYILYNVTIFFIYEPVKVTILCLMETYNSIEDGILLKY